MELKPGYKQTEVGVIPEDWSVVRLSVLISELNAGVSVNSVDEKLGLYGHTESVLKTSCILDGYFFPEECKKILPGDIGRAKLNPTKDSIVISRMNTPALVGECGYVDRDYSYLFLPDRLWQTIIRKEAGVNVRWLAYLLSFGQFSKAIKDTATGTSGSMKNISKESFLGLQVFFPDKREQTAIANALSDADALILSLTSLIAKKRQIKQGAMQTLLNPYENGRLKAGWVVKTIEDMCVPEGLIRGPFGGALKKECFVASGFKVYEQRNAIYRDAEIGSYFIDQKKYQELKRFSVKPGDFVISCSGTIGKIYQIPAGAPPGVINQALLKLTIDTEKFSEKYFYHYFSWSLFQEKIIDSTQGGAMKNLVGMSKFKITEMPIPEKLNEQTHIATILSDMDAEIAALEAKLAKYRHIKQGMMQNLLTGRIRLIQPDSNTGAVA